MKLETFFEKFDQFADAPDAVAKMRELVRHLAVTGTLVEQDDNDEPAMALLDKIAAHKTALAKEGKLRGPTTVAPMCPDEGTRVLPSSWTWVRFGEIMVNRDGERIPVSKEERATKAKTYDYYGASGVIDKIDGYLFDKPLLLIGEDGANLINRSTPIAFMARGQYWVNNHAHVLDGISEDFLRYIELHINAINLEAYVTGSAQPKMNQAKMNSIPIALPPLAEQKRIVAKVNELMALCDRLALQQQERETRHAALARASLARFADAPIPTNLPFLFHPSYAIRPADLRKSIFTLAVQGKLVPQDPNDEPAAGLLAQITRKKKAMIEAKTVRQGKVSRPHSALDAPAELPLGWEWVNVDSLCFKVTDGTHFTPQYAASGVRFVSAKDIVSGNLVFDRCKFITQEEHAQLYRRCNPEYHDIVISKSGSIGTVALVEDRDEFSLFESLALLKFDQTSLFPPFLVCSLTHACASLTTGHIRGVGVKHLHLDILRGLEIALPPLAEQRRIVAKVEQLMALVDALETQLAASRATAANLLSALVAELTGTPNDGKVSVPSASTTGRRGRPPKSP